MRETGYCREYIMGYSHELRWIEANAEKFDASSISFVMLKHRIGLKMESMQCRSVFLLGHENLNTTMKYLDITTEEKVKALATLETEEEHNTPKKWRTTNQVLLLFLVSPDKMIGTAPK